VPFLQWQELPAASAYRAQMRWTQVAQATLVIVACAGCGPHKQIAIAGNPESPSKISPLVAAGKLSGFGEVFRTANPSELLIFADEGTRDRRSPCWRAFRAKAVMRSPYPVISLIPTSKPNRVVCAEPGVGPFYVPVRLPSPYTGGDVVDAATGRVHAINSRVPYTSSELVAP
jgi:hypothetical protein